MADPNSRITGDEAARQAAEVAAELSETETPPDRRRVSKALGAITRSAKRDHAGIGVVVARHGTRLALWGTGLAIRTFTRLLAWLTRQVIAMAPRLQVRDTETLRAEFPGKTDDEIADLLISQAARAAAAVGGAAGAWAALPVLPAFPAEIAAETLAITGIEIKLVGELHEAYGLGVSGTATERGRAYIASWAHRRGVYTVPGGLMLVAGSPLAGHVRRRLVQRVRRSTFSLAPLFTGAVAGAVINSRETRKIGALIRDDLRNNPPPP